VVTPIQSLAGIAGNFESNTSKTFFGVGFVPSERDQMSNGMSTALVRKG
jgi:putative ABC transport system permease protein